MVMDFRWFGWCGGFGFVHGTWEGGEKRKGEKGRRGLGIIALVLRLASLSFAVWF
jgi:hypothetical protein